jgi:hypothetical protein
VRVREVAERLLDEADRVGGRAAHEAEQGRHEIAASYLQVQFGLILVAHTFAAVHEDDGEDEGA